MVSLDAQIRAVHTLKQAAMGLSAACVESLRTPQNAAPLVALYDRTMLYQDVSPDMAVLLGKLP